MKISSHAGGGYRAGRSSLGHRPARTAPVPVLVTQPVLHVGACEHDEAARRRARCSWHVTHVANEH